MNILKWYLKGVMISVLHMFTVHLYILFWGDAYWCPLPIFKFSFLSNYGLFVNSGYKFFIRFANILSHCVNFLFYFPPGWCPLKLRSVLLFLKSCLSVFYFSFISSEPTAFPICSAVNYVAFIRKCMAHSFSLFCLLFQLFYCFRCYHLHLIF